MAVGSTSEEHRDSQETYLERVGLESPEIYWVSTSENERISLWVLSGTHTYIRVQSSEENI